MSSQLNRELAKLRQGDHLCPIHDSLVEQTASAVAFIAAGLRNGERCLYVANDSPFEELVRRFAALGVNVAQETEKGSLSILTKHDVYLREGNFDAGKMLDYLAKCESAAVADGYAGLRFQGEMTWALDANLEGDRLIEYEALLNEFLASHRAVIACHFYEKLLLVKGQNRKKVRTLSVHVATAVGFTVSPSVMGTFCSTTLPV